jgi:uncharacterized membrane protein YphA (DoxX/SURF4 family)
MKRDPRALGPTELKIARILIAFYFIAVAVGFAEGVTLIPLFAGFLDPQVSAFASSSVLFVMGFLVLTGSLLRGVALMMSGLLLSVYLLTAIRTGGFEVPTTIWRDIALIGALTLTYAQRENVLLRALPKRRQAKSEDHGGLSKKEVDAMLQQVPGVAVRGLYVKPKTPRPELIAEVFRDKTAAS